MAKHPYIHLPGSTFIHRPYLEITIGNLQTNKYTPVIRAIPDSGSDICIGSKDIALWLGISFDEEEATLQLSAANGSTFSAMKKLVQLSVENIRYECPFFFVEGIDPDAPLLLGQYGFFDHFKVCFDFKKRWFEIA